MRFSTFVPGRARPLHLLLCQSNDCSNFLVKLYPALFEVLPGDDASCHVQLCFLRLWVVAQVDCLRRGQRRVGAPALAPQPVLRQAEYWDLVLGVVRQVLVQVRQRVRVPTKLVVNRPQLVPGRHAPEPHQVDDVQGADVVRLAVQVVLPETLAPELVPKRLLATRAERCVPVRGTLQVHVPQLSQVGPYYLVRVDCDNFWYIEREKNIQKQNLIAPDYPLLFGLTP